MIYINTTTIERNSLSLILWLLGQCVAYLGQYTFLLNRAPLDVMFLDQQIKMVLVLATPIHNRGCQRSECQNKRSGDSWTLGLCHDNQFVRWWIWSALWKEIWSSEKRFCVVIKRDIYHLYFYTYTVRALHSKYRHSTYVFGRKELVNYVSFKVEIKRCC